MNRTNGKGRKNLTTLTGTMFLATALLGAGGCKKDEAAAGGSAKAGEAPRAGEAPKGGGKDLGKPEFKKLEKLGLQLEVPASAEFMDTSADAPAGQYFTGNNECSVRVNQTTEMYTNDFDRAKAEIEKDSMNKFASWTKAEKTEDGWKLEWVAESTMEPGKKLYGVQHRRKFADKQVECWEKAPSAEYAGCTVRACESLKPL